MSWKNNDQVDPIDEKLEELKKKEECYKTIADEMCSNLKSIKEIDTEYENLCRRKQMVLTIVITVLVVCAVILTLGIYFGNF